MPAARLACSSLHQIFLWECFPAPSSRCGTQLQPGDQVAIFSDGVTEAQNTTRNFFGDSRLKDLLKQSRGIPMHETCTRVVVAVENFAGLAQQTDDITIVLVPLEITTI